MSSKLGGQPFVLVHRTSDERIPSGKTGRNHHSVKYKREWSSAISGGDFFVIFGRAGKDINEIDKFSISNEQDWGAIWMKRDDSGTIRTARRGSGSGEGSQGAWD